MGERKVFLFAVPLLTTALFGGSAFAETSVTENTSITIPISCSITNTVNSAHTATVNLGTYVQDIGESTFKVLCNDAEGFSVYAVGYSGDTYGNTTMVPASIPASNGIATGTATSGNTSNWAMKLTAVSGDYAPTIITGFNAYHAVPSEYTKVATFASTTDAVSGSSFKSTYAAYAQQAQPGDTYTGKVKYTVVHPSSDSPIADDRIRVVFNGDGLTFPGGATTNTVEYADTCTDVEGYLGSDYEEVMTSNISTGGTKTNGYSNNEYLDSRVFIQDADKLKVVITYGITANTGGLAIWNNDIGLNFEIYDQDTNSADTRTFIINSNELNYYFDSWDTPIEDYDYGFYMQVYPIYNEPHQGATYGVIGQSCGWQAVSGTYAETTDQFEYWYNNEGQYYSEAELLSYIDYYKEQFYGTSISVYAYSPYTITYNGNGATAGTMEDFNNVLNGGDNNYFLSPNYYKTGYGFAGWSQDSSATVNGNSTIFGPNEEIDESKLTFNSSHEAVLYAVWVQSAGNLQNWSGCGSMSIGDVTALSDSRDNNTYAVAKLTDGKCWMIENLRLSHTANVTTTNTQNNNGSFGGVFSGLANPEYSNFNTTTPNSLYTTDTSSTTLNIITGNNNLVNQFPRYNDNNSHIDGISFSGTTLVTDPYRNGNYNNQWYSFGNYYSWAAAIADTSDHINNGNTVSNTSLCPLGWHIPTGGTAGEFADYSVSLGGLRTEMRYDTTPTGDLMSKKFREYPNNFIYSFSYTSGGLFGTWWSSTVYDSGRVYGFHIESFYASPSNTGVMTKNSLQSIRCIAD